MLKGNRSDKSESLCWGKSTQPNALRIEHPNGEAFIIPYIHLLHAVLNQDAERDHLVLTYPGHEIHVIGKHLHELAVGIQTFSVEWIRPLSSRQAQLRRAEVIVEQAVIKEINK